MKKWRNGSVIILQVELKVNFKLNLKLLYYLVVWKWMKMKVDFIKKKNYVIKLLLLGNIYFI